MEERRVQGLQGLEVREIQGRSKEDWEWLVWEKENQGPEGVYASGQ